MRVKTMMMSNNFDNQPKSIPRSVRPCCGHITKRGEVCRAKCASTVEGVIAPYCRNHGGLTLEEGIWLDHWRNVQRLQRFRMTMEYTVRDLEEYLIYPSNRSPKLCAHLEDFRTILKVVSEAEAELLQGFYKDAEVADAPVADAPVAAVQAVEEYASLEEMERILAGMGGVMVEGRLVALPNTEGEH